MSDGFESRRWAIFQAEGAPASAEALLRRPLPPNLPLDAFYIPTRYPNSLPDSVPARVYRAEQSADALARAKEAVAAVRAHFR